MAILTSCPSCQVRFRLDDDLVGKHLRCPRCSSVFRAPAGASETGADNEPPPEPYSEPTRRRREDPVDELEPIAADIDDDALPRRRRHYRSTFEGRPRRRPSGSIGTVLAILGAVFAVALACVVLVVFVFDLKEAPIAQQRRNIRNFPNIPPAIQVQPWQKAQQPFQGEPEPITVNDFQGDYLVFGRVTPFDTVPRYRVLGKTYRLPLQQGFEYVIDQAGMDRNFDSLLRLETDTGVLLHDNDDTDGLNGARIVFRPERTGTYRIIASSCGGTATGDFALSVRTRSITPPSVDPKLAEDVERVYLSDMQERDVLPGRGGFVKNGRRRALADTLFQVQEKTYDKGLSMPPPDAGQHRVRYGLGGKAVRFETAIAVADTTPPSAGAVRFYVFGDGKLLWSATSPAVKGAPQKVTLDLRNVQELELATAAPLPQNFAEPVWLDPVLIKAE